MSTTPRKFSLTNNRFGDRAGRRIAGSWGRPGKGRHVQANRGVRRAAKKELRYAEVS